MCIHIAPQSKLAERRAALTDLDRSEVWQTVPPKHDFLSIKEHGPPERLRSLDIGVPPRTRGGPVAAEATLGGKGLTTWSSHGSFAAPAYCAPRPTSTRYGIHFTYSEHSALLPILKFSQPSYLDIGYHRQWG